MSEFREARLSKAKSLLDRGFNPYSETFVVSHDSKFLIEKYDFLENGQEFINAKLIDFCIFKSVFFEILFISFDENKSLLDWVLIFENFFSYFITALSPFFFTSLIILLTIEV